MTNYLTKQQFSAAKSRLTRAKNSGDPHKVVAVVTAQFDEWNDGDYAYPDNWHDWQRALDDADYAIRRAS
jgi:hypothetical protein